MKVLMVCLGNNCRSPLAEGILSDMIIKNNLDWSVDSAGTSDWHVGNLPHKGSVEIANRHNIDITNQRSRQFIKEDFERFDLILAMDSENYSNIINLAENEASIKKVALMLNYAYPNRNMAVPDPYYTGNFQEVYDLLYLACKNIIIEHKKSV